MKISEVSEQSGLSVDTLRYYEKIGIGLVPYSPMGRGYLTGKIDEKTTFDSSDIRSRKTRLTAEAIKVNKVAVDLLERISTKYDSTW